MEMDARLKVLLQELGNKINESLSESDAIAEVIAKIKRMGYDTFLVLEATIGVNKRPEGEIQDADAGGKEQISGTPIKVTTEFLSGAEAEKKFESDFTEEDRKLLQGHQDIIRKINEASPKKPT